MKRGALLAVGLSLVLVATFSGTAPAAVTLGQIGTAEPCSENYSHAQQAITSGAPYRATEYGVITSWSTAPAVEDGHTLQLLVLTYRAGPGGVGNLFAVLKKDVVRAPSATAVTTFRDVHVPIEAGELLGLYVPPGQPLVMGIPAGRCSFATGVAGDIFRRHPGEPPLGTELDWTSAQNFSRLNVMATVEPDVDRDGFGDETQDRCPHSAATQHFCTCGGRQPTLLGDEKDNILRGTPRADVIVGLGGNDRIRSRGRRDYICAGDGNDRLSGGGGGDILLGEAGRDILSGGPGSDALYGGKGRDKLRGGPGKDGLHQR